ncbi:SLC13 family permease [Agromyces mangrovi Wang et al. 2018]|uniref:SLC13 family permease n=1 Tax=Agromyces mangrovi TaxID=1858653 RepID=UPI0025738DBF|nr:SLC13 family permease [Agromyces mangrovi]
MNGELLLVLALLAAAIALFAIGRPRMDVVAVLVVVALPLTGVLTVPETLAGFADPNVILIAALFVVGEGLSRTGVTYRLGDWLADRAGASATRLIVLLMLSVALLGAVMSSTGVVAIFIPVVLSIAARTGMSPRQLMMPLSFAGLISGMLTLIATAPNLVVDAELQRHGNEGFDFFSVTPFGLVVLALGIGYMLFAQRMLGDGGAGVATASRRTFRTLVGDYGVDRRTGRYLVGSGSPLVGVPLSGIVFDDAPSSVLALERRRFLRGTSLATSGDATVARGDTLVLDIAPGATELARLHLEEVDLPGDFFESYSRQVGMAEVMVAPDSAAVGRSVRDLRFRTEHDLTVLGVRHAGHAADSGFGDQRLRAGDTLLVTGGWDAVHRLQEAKRDYLALDLPAEVDEVAPAADRAPFALASVGVMVLLMVTGVVPNVIAGLIGALLMGLSGAITMPAAYRAIHWPTLLLIAGMLPFAQALEVTGGIDLAADALLSAFGDAGPRVLLMALFATTAVIGLFVSNTATAVLMAPIAITTAEHLGVSPYPFAMIVILAASSAFMTPVSSPVNTLVVEPGRYRFGDFVRVGVPFTAIVLVVSVFLVPILLPY